MSDILKNAVGETIWKTEIQNFPEWKVCHNVSGIPERGNA